MQLVEEELAIKLCVGG